MDAILSTEQLCYQLPSATDTIHIIDKLSFSLAVGESLAIVGRSGSGKTTLLNLLAGLMSPTSGHIHLLNQPLHILDEDARTKLRLGRVAFVFQDFQLLPMLTALENVMLPLELMDDAQAKVKALGLLQQLGLDNRTGHLPNQLSGGEQQRVALARAFVTQPDILFADEPTGNLDEQTAAQVIALLWQLQQLYHTTLVLVTHEHSLATQCQHQLHLPNGTWQ